MAAAAPPPQRVRGFDDVLSREAIEEALRDAPGNPPEDSLVCVGDVIDTSSQEGFLRGHGTQVVDGQLVATVCGVVQRVNKLVAVRPLHSRYSAEVGDIVVGRVAEIVGKKWRVDLRSRQEAALMLSAVNLPGGVQRRRTAEDELNMRELYCEGDLISAEVQSFYHDGSLALHTRSRKYGKLSRGQLVEVPPALIQRQKQHLTTLQDLGVDIVLGVNGLIWLAPHLPQPEGADDPGGPVVAPADDVGSAAPPPPPVTRSEFDAVARAAAAVGALRDLYLPVSPGAISGVAALAAGSGVGAAGMREPAFLGAVLAQELDRRAS